MLNIYNDPTAIRISRMPPEELQEVVNAIVYGLLRSRAFEDARIRGKYWQVILDGTQLASSSRKLDGECLYRIHNRGEENEYTEHYYYVLEAKLYLHENIYVSIMTEFVENGDSEAQKQDCERKAAKRLMACLKARFPMLPICISADSLYANAALTNKIVSNRNRGKACEIFRETRRTILKIRKTALSAETKQLSQALRNPLFSVFRVMKDGSGTLDSSYSTLLKDHSSTTPVAFDASARGSA